MTFLNHKLSFEEYFPQPDPELMLKQYFWRIHDMVHEKNFNFMAMVTGKHRTGKSLSAVNMADLLDPTFAPNLEQRVVYTPSQFIETLNKIRDQNIIGGAVVWDESGVGLGSRDFQTLVSRSINHSIQVMGYLRPIIYFVTLDMSFLDAQPRRLLHAVYQVSRTSNKYSNIKPFFVDYNTWYGKTFRHYPIYVGKIDDHAYTPVYKIRNLKMTLPPDDLRGRYIEHSQQFKDITLQDVRSEVDVFDRDKAEEQNVISIEEVVNKVVKDPDLFKTPRSSPKRIILQVDAIKHTFGLSQGKARAVKQLSEMKLREKK